MRVHTRGTRGRRAGVAGFAGWVAAAALLWAGSGSAQEPGEAVMVAAAEWAKREIPGDDVRVDPHRTGQGVDAKVGERVARAVGARTATLEEMRQCSDVMDPSTCELGCGLLLAIGDPSVSGDQATVRLYAWYRGSSPREPVAKASWDLRLRRTGGGWEVVDVTAKD